MNPPGVPQEAARVAEALERLHGCILRLRDEASAVRQALVESHLGRLRAALERLKEALEAVRAEEAAARQVAASLARLLDLPEPATLSQIQHALERGGWLGEASRLREAAEGAAAAWQEVARLNHHNRALARHGLAAVRAALRLLAGGQDPLESSAPHPPVYLDRLA